jgi:hypothetical protein
MRSGRIAGQVSCLFNHSQAEHLPYSLEPPSRLGTKRPWKLDIKKAQPVKTARILYKGAPETADARNGRTMRQGK